MNPVAQRTSEEVSSMTISTEPRTYSIPEFARLLGVSRGYAYECAADGSIAGVPVIRVGRRMVLPRVVADRVLAGAAA